MPPKQKSWPSRPEAFTYAKHDADEILDTLRKAGLQEDADPAHLLKTITELARSALIRNAVRAKNRVPSASQAREEILGVAKEAAQLAKSLDELSPHVRAFLDGYLWNDDDQLVSKLSSHRLAAALVCVAKWAVLAAASLESARGPFPRRRPKDEVAHWFVLGLCPLYFVATGRLPGRQYDYTKEKAAGDFRAFVQAALGPTGLLRSRTSVDHLIRVACRQFARRPSREKIQPSAS